VELLRHLSEKHAFPHVPGYVGSLEYRNAEGESSALGLLIDYVSSSGDAWSYTRDAIDRFFEVILVGSDVDARSVEVPDSILDQGPAQVPDLFLEMADGFFLEMIELLGQRTGEMHLALAAERADPAFKPEPFSRLYQRSLYQSLRSLTRRVTASVRTTAGRGTAGRGTAGRLDEETDSLARKFLALEPTILDRFSRITSGRIEANKTRIHGDYHLGQVLFTGRDFVIIDLEGEPARTLSERRLKFSAFRDVAGMLRSFHYAIHSRYLETVGIRPEDGPRLEPWIPVWYTWVSTIFIRSYLETVDGAGFVPGEREGLETLLDVYLLEKAVYEIGYEINNRPEWLRIPLQGIRFVLRGCTDDDQSVSD